ncbi:MAG: protein-disulfide reductase DsbD [Epsilonproteobacteria bacterium]|nr:protein-disulfide reductase DsbD [Campylobacterota bacterium]
MKILKLILVLTAFLSAGFDDAKKNNAFLPPDEAFQVSATQGKESIDTVITLAPKIHVAENSLKYSIIKPKKIELEVKKPQSHKDEVSGDMIFSDEVKVAIPLKEIKSKVKGDFTLLIEYQGCSDVGMCYQPMSKEFSFKALGEEAGFIDKMSNLLNEANANNIAKAFSNESGLFIILLFFIFGVLLALTPCVFPMIPILSSIIVSHAGREKPSTAKAFFISLVYVVSMAITYTIIGVIAGLLGADIASAMQNPIVLGLFSAMFVALAFSLFGYYEIQLPASWQSKINKASDEAQSKGILGTAIMGFLSALIVGPCVAPPLAGAVLFISQTGDAFLGGISLFVMSIGMGLPLLLIGLGAGKFMPRPGGWMTRVSQTFGVMMLALAIFMLSRVIPDSLTLLLWSLLFMGVAFYMDVFGSAKNAQGAKKLFKLVAFVFMIYGVSLLVGVISGASSMLNPFEKFTTPKVAQFEQSSTKKETTATKTTQESKQTSDTQTISTVDIGDENTTQDTQVVVNDGVHTGYTLDKLLAEINASTKPVVIDFTKDACTSCKELEVITFPAPAVAEELKRFTFITVDLSENSEDDKKMLEYFKLFGTPNIIFFDSTHTHLEQKNLTGFIAPDIFAEHLKDIN